MKLKEQLDTKAAGTKSKLDPIKWNIMNDATNALVAAKHANQALKTGDIIKDFTLTNALGQNRTLTDLLGDGNVVLLFYRGGWCPYCNMELQALQSVLPQIKATGSQLVAISPELPDSALDTMEKNELEFEVLSDLDNNVAKSLNLVFTMPEELRDLYHNQFNIHVDKANGNKDYELPMAATYVINSKREIVFDWISEKYTERLEPEVLIEYLSKI